MTHVRENRTRNSREKLVRDTYVIPTCSKYPISRFEATNRVFACSKIFLARVSRVKYIERVLFRVSFSYEFLCHGLKCWNKTNQNI